MTFWNFTFFRKTFLDQCLWIFKWASWWCHPLTIFHVYHIWILEKFSFLVHTGKNISPYQNILELTLFLIYFGWLQGKFYIITVEIWDFYHFCICNEYKIVREWHHQLAHLNIHKDWSRSVFQKIVKFQNVITSLFFIRFWSFLHCSVGNFFLFHLKLMKFWCGFLL